MKALQEKVAKKIDVRIVAATNRDLSAEVAEGKFRADLFFRLNIFPISVPPLKERGNDIILLANHFMQKFADKINRPCPKIDSQTEQSLLNYSWPGNVRELQHVIERGVLFTDGEFLFNTLNEGESVMKSNIQKEFELKSLQEVERGCC